MGDVHSISAAIESRLTEANTEIARLEKVRELLVNGDATPPAPKAKRTRVAKAPKAPKAKVAKTEPAKAAVEAA